MKIWVVTGPIGAGKSTLSALLAQRGAAVVDADLLGHEVLRDPAIIQQIAKDFGPQCVVDGQVDRQCLGALVFADDQAMGRLNDLIHPALLELAATRLETLAKEGNHELAVLEAAVYFLWPPLEMVDLVISVVAHENVRLDRLRESRNLTEDQVRNRMQAQAHLDRYWHTADVVLENNHHRRALSDAVDHLLRDNNL